MEEAALDQESAETRGCRGHWAGAAVGQSHREIARFAHGANYIGHQFRDVGIATSGSWFFATRSNLSWVWSVPSGFIAHTCERPVRTLWVRPERRRGRLAGLSI
jgi:hypothetical protein